MKPRRPSQQFLSWLRRHVDTRPAGTKLPTIEELSKRFGLSPTTIKSKVKPLIADGLLVALPGRGTFVGPLDTAPEQESAGPGRSSSELLVDRIVREIVRGKLKRGDHLPAVKFVSIQYKMSSRSVSAAYRELVRLGYCTRMGKRCFVGDFLSLRSFRGFSEIAVFHNDSVPFDKLFTEHVLSRAFRELELELFAYGMRMVHAPLSRFPKCVRRWQTGAPRPAAIMLTDISQAQSREIRPLITGLHRHFEPSTLPLLMTSGYGVQRRPASMPLVSNASLPAALARAVTQYCSQKRFARLLYYHDQTRGGLTPFREAIRIIPELLYRRIPVDYTIAVKAPPGVRTPRQFLRQMPSYLDHKNFDYLENLLGKYTPIGIDYLERVMSLTPDFAQVCPRTPGTLCLFNDKLSAGEAVRHCRDAGIALPGTVAVLGMGDDPGYYRNDISTLVTDWHRLGYLMAHVLLGDIPIELSRRNFIRIPTRILERGSTAGYELVL